MTNSHTAEGSPTNSKAPALTLEEAAQAFRVAFEAEENKDSELRKLYADFSKETQEEAVASHQDRRERIFVDMIMDLCGNRDSGKELGRAMAKDYTHRYTQQEFFSQFILNYILSNAGKPEGRFDGRNWYVVKACRQIVKVLELDWMHAPEGREEFRKLLDQEPSMR